MNGPAERTRLSGFDRSRIEDVVAVLECWAHEVAPGLRIRRRPELCTDLFDCAARLRSVLIWDAEPAHEAETA